MKCVVRLHYYSRTVSINGDCFFFFFSFFFFFFFSFIWFLSQVRPNEPSFQNSIQLVYGCLEKRQKYWSEVLGKTWCNMASGCPQYLEPKVWLYSKQAWNNCYRFHLAVHSTLDHGTELRRTEHARQTVQLPYLLFIQLAKDTWAGSRLLA